MQNILSNSDLTQKKKATENIIWKIGEIRIEIQFTLITEMYPCYIS